MAYREDLEAALARIDALERQLAAEKAKHESERSGSIDALTAELAKVRQVVQVEHRGGGGHSGKGRVASAAKEHDSTSSRGHRSRDKWRDVVVDPHLAAAPRRTPGLFVLAEVMRASPWEVAAVIVAAIGVAVLRDMHHPKEGRAAAIGLLAIVVVWHAASAWRRLALLRWGEVARVTSVDVELSWLENHVDWWTGTTNYENGSVPVASGWDVDRSSYTGPECRRRVTYKTPQGASNALTYVGRDYAGGAILVDPRRPSRALCVDAFRYDLRRDGDGNWIGDLRAGVWFSVVLAACVIATFGWLIAR